MKISVRIALVILRVIYRLLLRWTVTGREHVPAEGALIVVANHVNFADPVLLMLAFPRRVTYMAKKELFRYPVLCTLLRDAGMFPVARGGALEQKRDIMRRAEALLNQGNVVALFPEGKRSPSGILLEGKPGAAILALHTGAPLVPVAIEGAHQIKGHWWWLRRPRVTVTIGPPFHLTAPEGRLARSESVRLTRDLMCRIAALLPFERRGPYAG